MTPRMAIIKKMKKEWKKEGKEGGREGVLFKKKGGK